MQLSDWLRATLACPRCKGPLTQPLSRRVPGSNQEGVELDELHCPSCRLAYPIRDAVPELLEDEARPLPSAS